MSTLTPAQFDAVVHTVLTRGDRLTWCSRFNNNPHLALGALDVFLNPDTGQRNINCDPALSGFDELVLRWGGFSSASIKRVGGEVLCEDAALPWVPQLLALVEAG